MQVQIVTIEDNTDAGKTIKVEHEPVKSSNVLWK